MELFITGILIRFFSGLKNSRYYAGNVPQSYLFCTWVGIALIGYASALPSFSDQQYSWWSLAFIVPVLALVRMGFLFKKGKTPSMHLWENLMQWSWTLIALIAGVDIPTLFASALVGNALFNMPIQYQAFGTLINRNMVRDKYSIRTWLGLNNGYVITAIGAIALLGWLAYYYFTYWHYNLHDLINY